MKLKLPVILAGLLAASAAAAQPPAPPPPPAPAPPDCSAPEHHQFDFWIGRWDVVDTKTGQPAGSSLIEGLYKGCVLRENWSEPGGVTGGSLNIYDRTDKRWHQTWADSGGGRHEYVGGLEEGKMVLTWIHPSVRFPGKVAHERMTFTHNTDGTVRQAAEATVDEGATWTALYDYTYKPAAPPPPPPGPTPPSPPPAH